jgi:hypothetical protein
MDQNIVFQVLDHTQQNPDWHNSKIVYVLTGVPSNYDVSDLVDAISVVLGNCTVRYSRSEIGRAINLESVNRLNGGYYQHIQR